MSPGKKKLITGAMAVLLFCAMEIVMQARPETELEPHYGDTLRLAYSMPISNLGKELTKYGVQAELIPFLYSFLLTPDRSGGYNPDLAESWSSDETGKRWTFTIRKNVKFHDGRSVQPDDVVYSIKKAFDRNMVLNKTLDSVTSDGVDKIIVDVKMRIPNFLQALSESCVVYQKPGNAISEQQQNVIGSGPFQVHYWDGERRLVLKQFPDYYKGQPYLSAIVIDYEPDNEKIWMDYMHDEVHACWAASPENVWLMRNEPTHYRLEGGVASSNILLLFNQGRFLFKDKRVRKALSSMLDLKYHILRDLRGLAEETPGPLGAYSRYNPVDSIPEKKSWDAARKLLKEAGWADHDGDNYLDKDGRAFEFELLVPMTFQTERKTALYIQRMLNQFGIKAHIVYKRYDMMLTENLHPGAFDACLTQFSSITNPGVFASLWSSRDWAAYNFGHYSNERVNQALDTVLNVNASSEELKTAYKTIHNQMMEDQPAVWLYHPYRIHAFSVRIQNMDHPNLNFFMTHSLLQSWLGPKPKWWPKLFDVEDHR